MRIDEPRKSNDFDKVAGEIITKLRKSRNYTQVQLADELGVSFQQVQKYEKAKNRLTLFRFIKICHILKYNPRSVMLEIEKQAREQ